MPRFLQTLELFFTKITGVGTFFALALSASAQTLSTNEQAHLVDALAELNMSIADLGFDKDQGEPEIVLNWIRETLREPLRLPQKADTLISGVTAKNSEAVWDTIRTLLEVQQPAPLDITNAIDTGLWEGLDPQLVETLSTFMVEARKADALLKKAFEQISSEEKSYLAASWLGGIFNLEDHPELRHVFTETGIADADIDTTLKENLELDSKPAAMHFLDIVKKIDRNTLIEAGHIFQQATKAVYKTAGGVTNWPAGNVMILTELGKIRIASTEDSIYSDEALLILEPGGHNVYRGKAGAANGLGKQTLSAIIDLGGDDMYDGKNLLGPASALFGISIVLDREGNDFYSAEFTGQGAGIFGVGWQDDHDGKDIYKAHAVAQAAAIAGIGYLRDRRGSDQYNVGFYGQGFSGVLGAGLLVDDQGHDLYFAGAREPDHERNDDRFLSLAQGFSIGMRPFAGGGVAALIDLQGNDRYVADIYGQGVSYWYSAGFLLDAQGNDTYSMHQYGQGSGIHSSLGLLDDGAGNDMYTGYILAQGNAHDFAVGMLFDHGGDDTYTADHHAQGRALNNALAILIDTDGNDAYFGRQNDQCQGIGNSGDKREYGSLAVLLDLNGQDLYSSGTTNGIAYPRPDYGIVYDLKRDEK